MTAESAFRPYYKPVIPHTSAGYEQMMMQQRNLYSSPEPSRVSSSSPGTCGGKSEKARRRRTTFTPEQTYALEREYLTDRYMDSSKRAHLAEVLQLNEIQVKTWFQNRRAKDKKEGKIGNSESPRQLQKPPMAFDQQPNGSSDAQQQQQPAAQEISQQTIQEERVDVDGEQKEEMGATTPAVTNTAQIINPYAWVTTPVLPKKSVSPIDRNVLLHHPALKAALDSPAQTPRSSPPSIMTSIAPNNTVITPPATTSPQMDAGLKPEPQQFIPAYKFGDEVATSVAQPQPIGGAPNSYADYLRGIRQFAMPTYAPMYDVYAAASATNTADYGLHNGLFAAAALAAQFNQAQQQQQQQQSLTNL